MKTTNLINAVIVTATLTVVHATVWAQGPDVATQPARIERDNVVIFRGNAATAQCFPGMPMGEDPMGENFFPPELIMHHQKAIGLRDEQQKAIRAEMQKVTAKVSDLQWDLTSAKQEMDSLAKEGKVDEKQMLAQLDKLLGVENEMKRLQIGLMIKVKNVLTAEQQGKLKELKNRFFEMGVPMPMGVMREGVAIPMTAPGSAPASGGVEIMTSPTRESPKR